MLDTMRFMALLEEGLQLRVHLHASSTSIPPDLQGELDDFILRVPFAKMAFSHHLMAMRKAAATRRYQITRCEKLARSSIPLGRIGVFPLIPPGAQTMLIGISQAQLDG